MTNNKGSAAWMAPEVFEGTIKWYFVKLDEGVIVIFRFSLDNLANKS